MTAFSIIEEAAWEGRFRKSSSRTWRHAALRGDDPSTAAGLDNIVTA
jgi:hypothetical protein